MCMLLFRHGFLCIIVRAKLNIACNLRVQICNYKCSTDLLCMYIRMVSIFVLFVQLIMWRYRLYTHCLETKVYQVYAIIKSFLCNTCYMSNTFHVSGQKLTKHFLIDKKVSRVRSFYFN